MTLANKVTLLRLILAPFFFVLFLHPGIESGFLDSAGFLAVLWVLFIVIELTDMLDGQIARGRNEVSDFGKLFDPFADTLVRITYFLCFIISGILPVVPFLVILFREFGILFLRILMMKKGVVMGARKGGKLKAVAYMLTGAACLLEVTMERLGFTDMVEPFRRAAIIIFVIAMIISVVSFVDYFRLYRQTEARA